MKTIWKFPVEVADSFGLDMPVGAEVLSVQVQNGTPMIWATVDDGLMRERRMFAVRGTGHYMSETESRFVGTFQLPELGLVFHLFEVAR